MNDFALPSDIFDERNNWSPGKEKDTAPPPPNSHLSCFSHSLQGCISRSKMASSCPPTTTSMSHRLHLQSHQPRPSNIPSFSTVLSLRPAAVSWEGTLFNYPSLFTGRVQRPWPPRLNFKWITEGTAKQCHTWQAITLGDVSLSKGHSWRHCCYVQLLLFGWLLTDVSLEFSPCVAGGVWTETQYGPALAGMNLKRETEGEECHVIQMKM